MEPVKRSDLRLNVENMKAESLGSQQGITSEELEALQERVLDGHQRLMDKEGKARAFIDLPLSQRKTVEEIEELVEERRGEFKNFVLLGIGGSALGNMALFRALKPAHYNLFSDLRSGYPRLFITNNIDPEEWALLLERIDPAETLFNVVSKSGSTAETMSLFMVARELVRERVGADWSDHFIATTGQAQGPLYQLASEAGIPLLYLPEQVEGRFSVFTAVGLLSSAFVNIDIRRLLAGAERMRQRCLDPQLENNPAYLNAALHYLAAKKGKKISVFMPYAHALEYTADWYRQLWAESLGKRYDRQGQEVYKGYTPVKALGATDQHSQLQLYMEGPKDKVITFLEVEEYRKDLQIPSSCSPQGLEHLSGHSLARLLQAEKKGTEEALTSAGRMNCTLTLPQINEDTMGQLLYLLQLQTACAGELENINAFNQPGVELGKRLTIDLLQRDQD